MCDYSLHHVANRPAKIEDKLVTTKLELAEDPFLPSANAFILAEPQPLNGAGREILHHDLDRSAQLIIEPAFAARSSRLRLLSP
jgi:hypothetical protein